MTIARPLLATALVLAAPDGRAQTPFVVTTTANGGAGSLRAAIQSANAAQNGDGPDVITFDIPGTGPFTIEPTSELPAITEAVVIDGLSQPGADCSSWPATLQIEVSGRLAGLDSDGLSFEDEGGSTVRGLVVNRFDGDGIDVDGAGGNTFECNYVGTDVTGMEARPNDDDGFDVASSDNVIGGSVPSARNLISGNREDGVDIDGFDFDANRNEVRGNYIGVAADGTRPLGNGDDGVEVQYGASDAVIGGDAETQGNLIAYNGDSGVQVEEASSVRNAILGNAILGNDGLGIDLGADGRSANDSGDRDTGPNRRQNFPELTTARTAANTSTTTVDGTLASLANGTYRIELFANAALDASGHGEGGTFVGAVGVVTDAGGDATFSVELVEPLEAGLFVTATATDVDGNTSEFGEGVEVEALNNVASEDDAEGDLSLTVAPNPTSTSADVTYGVAEAGPVEVALFDALGRVVAVPVSGVQPAGRHTAPVLLAALPPGVYVVRVTAGAAARSALLTIVR